MRGSIVKSYLLFMLRSCLPLIALPILANRLGVASFGMILADQSLGLIGSLIIQFGFHVTCSRELGISSTANETGRVVGSVLFAQFFTILIALIFIYLATEIGGGQGSLDIVGISIIAIGVGITPSWYFRGTGRAPIGMAIELVGQVIAFISIVAFVWTPNDKLISLFLMGFGPTLSSLFGLVWMLREIGSTCSFSARSTFIRISGSFALFLVRLSSSGLTIGSAWIASLLIAPNEVAFFGVAAKIVSAISSLSQPVLFAVLPQISRIAAYESEKLSKAGLKWGAGLVVLALMSSMAVYVAATPIIQFLFSPDMIGAASATRVLIWVCVISAFRDALGDLVLVALHKDSSVAVSVAAGAIFTVIFSFLLAPRYQSEGMAAARIGGEALTVIMMTVFVLRYRKSLSP